MIEPADVVEGVRARRSRSDEPVRVYWVTVTPETKPSGRGEFVAAMKGLTSSEAVWAVALQPKHFTDPDLVTDDLDTMLADIKDDILTFPLKERIERIGSLDVVVVSRSSFKLAMTSSPLQLPDWFPVSPGRVVKVSVTDLTLGVTVPLSKLDTGEICRLLFDLDQAVSRRIRAGLEKDPQLVNSFLDRLWDADKNAPRYEDRLIAVEDKLKAVKNPRDFRPSTSRNPTFTGQIWRMANAKSADGLVKFAASLSRAAQVESGDLDDFQEALLAVLARPSQGLPDMDARWAFNVIMSVQGACRLVTAAAHADDYGEYPAWLLRSLSLDLRKSLAAAVELLTS